MADAVTSALPNQTPPQGYYNVERMVQAIISKGRQFRICGTCAEGRDIHSLGLIEKTEISTVCQLAQWVVESDKVLTF
jgi:uncharacterized protein involved in oxidation of intracellular sulfur